MKARLYDSVRSAAAESQQMRWTRPGFCANAISGSTRSAPIARNTRLRNVALMPPSFSASGRAPVASAGSTLPGRLGSELRAAQTHPPVRVLPQLLVDVQLAERARDRLQRDVRKRVDHFGVVERLLADHRDDPVGDAGDLVVRRLAVAG